MSKQAAKAATDGREASFPGGSVRPDEGELRIAIEKQPYAEVIGHAVQEPEVEICGVLVGVARRDAHGPYLHIRHAIRGEAAKQQGAQVTFTHDTWNHIHHEMDERYPDERIVGWYHTHGGFGVFLSEMDTFIHRNFFGEPHQVAYVYDPLDGSEGFFHLVGSEFRAARRYWLAGKERRIAARAPARGGAGAAAGTEGARHETGASSSSGDLAGAVAALNRTAGALQAAVQQQGEGLPTIAWVVIAIVAVLFGNTMLAGRLPGATSGGGHGASAMAVVATDPASGRLLGIELVPLEPDAAGVVRDPGGQSYPALDLTNGDVAGLTVRDLMNRLYRDIARQGASRGRPATPTPAAPEKNAARSWLLPGLLAAGGALLLAAAGVAGWLFWRRRSRADTA